jgi:hypothetical protein
MNITQIKYNEKDGKVFLAWEEVNPKSGDENERTFRSTQKPAPEFFHALNALTSFVEEICTFPVGFCDTASIRNVSISWAHGIMGVVVTAIIPLETANSPLCINTPHITQSQYSDGANAPLLKNSQVELFKELLYQAEQYIKGEREQPSLFGEIADSIEITQDDNAIIEEILSETRKEFLSESIEKVIGHKSNVINPVENFDAKPSADFTPIPDNTSSNMRLANNVI